MQQTLDLERRDHNVTHKEVEATRAECDTKRQALSSLRLERDELDKQLHQQSQTSASSKDVQHSEEELQQRITDEVNKWSVKLNTAYTKQLDRMKEENAKLIQKIDENECEASNNA